mmetsp:Transcript_125801/g.218110  ORF Transcript_125801/g.218110 Transcript_125801/m.218110 type:complete len:82 (-) Transcript_125801:8-253(-)
MGEQAILKPSTAPKISECPYQAREVFPAQNQGPMFFWGGVPSAAAGVAKGGKITNYIPENDGGNCTQNVHASPPPPPPRAL